MKFTNSKRIKRAWEWYCDSNDVNLSDVYTKCSQDKKDAYKTCVAVQEEYNGEDLRITSHSIYTFTVGFRFIHEGKKAFCWITPTEQWFTYI